MEILFIPAAVIMNPTTLAYINLFKQFGKLSTPVSRLTSQDVF